MATGSFKVFTFDGLRGLGGTLRYVGSKPGVLGAGSVIRLIPEQGPTESWETTLWTTRLVHNCTDEYGTGRIPLVVNRQILMRLVIDQLPVQGSPAQGDTPALVRTGEATTVALREPVTLDSIFNTAHTGGLYEYQNSDIDTSQVGEACKGAQTLGVDVQVALPSGVLLEVVEAAPGSSDWLLPKDQSPPYLPPGPPGPVTGSGARLWLPVIGALALLWVAGRLIFGGKR